MFHKYLWANWRKEKGGKVRDIWFSHCVKNINDSVASLVGGNVMKVSYEDALYPKPEETRTADEIIEDIGNRLDKLGESDGFTELEGSSDA